MEISYYLKRPKAETATSIFARISYEGIELKYYIPEKIHPVFWNKEKHRAREKQSFPEFPEFNARLNNIETAIKNVFRKYMNDNRNLIPHPDTLKGLLDIEIKKKEIKEEGKISFFEFYEDFNRRMKNGSRINRKSKKPVLLSKNRGYVTTLNHLKAFETYQKSLPENKNFVVDFHTIDLDFYDGYIEYLTNKLHLGLNTIGDHIRRIKTIMGEAATKRLHNNMVFESEYFSKPNEETESIYLNDAEIAILESLDLSTNKRLDVIRDFFLIGCHTGLRFCDYSVLRMDQIIDGYIETTQLKTAGKVVIPVHSTVEKIISKYNGTLPVPRSNQKMNDYLKEIGLLASKEIEKQNLPLPRFFTKTFTKGGHKVSVTKPKWECISTHTGRRSFATNEYLAGTPTITIMAITGHKTEKSFLKYIKLSPNDHAKIMKMSWAKRAALKTV